MIEGIPTQQNTQRSIPKLGELPPPSRPLDDARILLLGEEGNDPLMRQRMEHNRLLFESGDLGKILGPTETLDAIFNRMFDSKNIVRQPESEAGFQHDLAIIKRRFPEIVQNIEMYKSAIEERRKKLGVKLAADKINDEYQLLSAVSPYFYFTDCVGEENQYDQMMQKEEFSELPEFTDISFRRWLPDDSENKFSNDGKVAGSANAFIFNTIFDPRHQYRSKEEAKKLVDYVVAEADKRLKLPNVE